MYCMYVRAFDTFDNHILPCAKKVLNTLLYMYIYMYFFSIHITKYKFHWTLDLTEIKSICQQKFIHSIKDSVKGLFTVLSYISNSQYDTHIDDN